MSLSTTINQHSIVASAPERISSDLAGETVILDLKSGMYYGLNEVGSTIWNSIQQPKSVSEVRNLLLETYPVESDRCERDLLSLLEELNGLGLIEVKDEETA